METSLADIEHILALVVAASTALLVLARAVAKITPGEGDDRMVDKAVEFFARFGIDPFPRKKTVQPAEEKTNV